MSFDLKNFIGDVTGIGSIAELAGSVVDRLIPESASEQDKINAQVATEKIIATKFVAMTKAMSQIIAAEMASGDKLVKWCRPILVYMGVVFIFLLYVFMPMMAFFWERAMPDLSLPAEFWWSWTGLVGVWMGGRTYEKSKGVVGGAKPLIQKIISG